MIGKALTLLKTNPVIILFYIIYTVITSVFLIVLIPGKIDQTDIVDLLLAAAGIMLSAFFVGIIGLVFLSGFGHMLAEAVTTGKTSLRSFFPGIKRFIIKLLLTFLLFLAIYVAYTIILSIAFVPVMLLLAMGNPQNVAAAGTSANVTLTAVFSLAVLASIPFVILWFPAIFIDGVRITEALKRGFKTGIKNYGILLLWNLVLYLPAFIYSMTNRSSLSGGFTFSAGYAFVILLSAIISLIYFSSIFILYNEKKQITVKDLTRQ